MWKDNIVTISNNICLHNHYKSSLYIEDLRKSGNSSNSRNNWLFFMIEFNIDEIGVTKLANKNPIILVFDKN